MYDEQLPDDTGAGVRMIRRIAPWIALLAIMWALASFFAQFRVAASSADQGSAVASSSVSATASVVTTVTGMSATLRTDYPMISEPATSAAKVATLKAGSVVQVVAKTGTWLKVKDASSRLGWVPNDVKYLTIKLK
jgi:hypothetical protein